MISASFAFSAMALFVKWASQTLPSLEVVFFRSVIGSIMIFTVIKIKGLPVWGKQKRLMALRGLSGFLALTLNFVTIAHLPLGTAILLNYIGPIFAVLFAFLFLKEKISASRAALILLSFIGVALLAGARLYAWDAMILLGLLSAVFVGIVYISIRAIQNESPYTIIFYFTMVSTLGSLFFLPFGFKWPDLREWLLILGVGIGSFWGQLWFTLSVQKAPTSVAGPFSYLTPLMSYLYGLFFFGEKLTPMALCGAFLIILSGCLITYSETRKNLLP